MIRRALLIVVALLLPVLTQAQVKLLRYPTYSKGKVAFSYLGDIWVANENGPAACTPAWPPSPASPLFPTMRHGKLIDRDPWPIPTPA